MLMLLAVVFMVWFSMLLNLSIFCRAAPSARRPPAPSPRRAPSRSPALHPNTRSSLMGGWSRRRRKGQNTRPSHARTWGASTPLAQSPRCPPHPPSMALLRPPRPLRARLSALNPRPPGRPATTRPPPWTTARTQRRHPSPHPPAPATRGVQRKTIRTAGKRRPLICK